MGPICPYFTEHIPGQIFFGLLLFIICSISFFFIMPNEDNQANEANGLDEANEANKAIEANEANQIHTQEIFKLSISFGF